MARLTREAWLHAGLTILAERGISYLTIEQLTLALHVTKGSFYHHFTNFHAYKQALLEFFVQVRTEQVIIDVEQETNPARKLRLLFAMAAYRPSPVEVVVRAWAMQDDGVRQIQAQIDQQRLAYLERICEDLGVDRLQARLMSRLAYSILIGTQHMQHGLPPDDVHALFNEFCRIYQIDESVVSQPS